MNGASLICKDTEALKGIEISSPFLPTRIWLDLPRNKCQGIETA